jgi:RNA polymerase sigma-70 factor, ECF subfamily
VTEAAALYHRYGPALRRKCERMSMPTEDAEDVVQQVFTDLGRRGIDAVDLPYLFRAVTTRALNLLRDGRRRQRLLARHGEVLTPPSVHTEAQVASREVLLRLVAELPVQTAEILVYRYFDGLTQEEIAEVASLSRKTVGKRLDEIRDALAAVEAR